MTYATSQRSNSNSDFFVLTLAQKQAMERKWFRKVTRAFVPKKTPKNRYKLLERRLALLGEQWPPIVGKKMHAGDEDLKCLTSLDGFISLPS